VPIVVPGLTDVVEVALGRDFACARHATGAVSCWGDGRYGQLGDGSTTWRPTPGPVTGIGDAIDLAAREVTACAVRATGEVMCWGQIATGQAGDCTMPTVMVTATYTPVAAAGISGALAVAVGHHFQCALIEGGAVVCWGINLCGQLGIGSTMFRGGAVPLGLTGVVELAAGTRHACARFAIGDEVRCWGANAYGELGDGTTVDRPSPVVAAELGPAAQITLGAELTCVRRVAGAVTCRGTDLSGQRGDGSAATPTDVSGLDDATFVGTAHESGFAIRATGDAVAWGRGVEGDLGSGAFADSTTPVSIVPP
jgi:alpha-tubulin suppressor-like RCC1 family protein